MTDNVATLDGYTEEVYMEGGGYDLFLLVKPRTDLDGEFKAWDTDCQEFIKVSGWMFTIVEEEA
tara:strand:+ start:809 stop:1000 length:192 start_codon:yes stop_codon:yes gene_type:complete